MSNRNKTSHKGDKQLASISALLELGLLHHKQGRLDHAKQIYQQVFAINAKHFDALHLTGIVEYQSSNYEKAIELFYEAITINAAHAACYYNLGNAQKELKQPEQALISYNKSIELDSKDAKCLSNRGVVLRELGQFDESMDSFQRALHIQPDYAAANFNFGELSLLKGNFSEGWKYYEWRSKWKYKDKSIGFNQPLWSGEQQIKDKTILLHAEQGLGDTVQFCRYAKLVKQQGAKLILEIPKPLLRLMIALEGVDQLIEKGKALPEFDYHCPLMSLPLAFKTELPSIPDTTPYLASETQIRELWAKRLGVKTKLRVGLVWSGNPEHTNDHNRSLTLQTIWAHLSELRAIEFVSLQKDIRDGDKGWMAESGIRHFADELQDFADTAALCDLMDLVISVDTSVAHTAGAIGKKTWILLPFVPDWRWLLDREDSPWYPTVKIYRQPSLGDWRSVMQRVREDLMQLCSIN